MKKKKCMKCARARGETRDVYNNDFFFLTWGRKCATTTLRPRSEKNGGGGGNETWQKSQVVGWEKDDNITFFPSLLNSFALPFAKIARVTFLKLRWNIFYKILFLIKKIKNKMRNELVGSINKRKSRSNSCFFFFTFVKKKVKHADCYYYHFFFCIYSYGGRHMAVALIFIQFHATRSACRRKIFMYNANTRARWIKRGWRRNNLYFPNIH